VGGLMQLPEPSQQPLGHVEAEHSGGVQEPLEHVWLLAQAGLIPHRQVPPLQLSAFVGSQGAEPQSVQV